MVEMKVFDKPTAPHKMGNEKITFEEALDLTKFGKFNYAIIALGGMVLSAVLWESTGLSFVLPVSQCDLNLSTQDKGILSAVGFAGIICASFLWGYLADTTGRRNVMQPTLFAAFACTFLSTFTGKFIIFATLRFFTGFFVSGSFGTIFAYMGEFHNERHRSRAIMCASVIYGIVCILLPAIAWLVINQSWEFTMPIIERVFKPWRLFLIVCATPSLLCSLALIVLPESPKFVLAQGDQKGAIAILEQMNRWNNGNNARPLQISEIYEEAEAIENRQKILENKNNSFSLLRSIWAQTAPLFMAPHLKTTILACFIQFGIFLTANGLYMWFPDILNRVTTGANEDPGVPMTMCQFISTSPKGNVSELAAIVSDEMKMICITELEVSTYQHGILLEMVYAIGFGVIGAIINVVGKLPIIFGICVICGIGGIASVFVEIPSLAIYLYMTLMCSGLAMSVVNVATVDLYPTNLRAMAVCVISMIGRLGCVVGSNLVGILLDNYCEIAFISCGAFLVVCGFLASLIPNIRLQKRVDPRYLEHRGSISSLAR